MDLVRNEYPCSYSAPLQIATSPETPTLAGKKRSGRKMLNETRHPVYRGVRRKNGGKWVCEVREPNKKSRIWLGTFPSPETAAVAHDVAALALRGDHAPLNFPNAASHLPRPSSASHQDIQLAASEAARDFCPVSIRVSEIQRAASEAARGFCPVSIRVSQERKMVINSSDTNWSGEKDDSCGVESSEDCWSCNQSPSPESGELGEFVDEEAVFNMPALLDSMAEGMLLTPLAMKKGFSWNQYEMDDEGVDLSLWVD